eukprot:CAMPEP_0184310526 /NCGR_PEP_ID=MMETSP1049-20130417/31106_1 /TAXON_ID=77928 /ORGANISM="Proteomonas sulcata, Strain CCMP704" /LENGTH=160 /DNA_ID=CAMNT_0026624807 /DNA_START=1 /DNA_END=483 /DNA_ORIENTATION=+
MAAKGFQRAAASAIASARPRMALSGPQVSRVVAGAQTRSFQTTQPLAAKEYIGEGLNPDPTRGVRINHEAFYSYPGVLRSSEYEYVLEQDPLGEKWETGGNDDIWGEWGLNKDAKLYSTNQCATMFGIAITGLYCFYSYVKASTVNLKHVAAPREGVWSQ